MLVPHHSSGRCQGPCYSYNSLVKNQGEFSSLGLERTVLRYSRLGYSKAAV